MHSKLSIFLTARQGRNTARQTPPQAQDNALVMGFLENKIFIIYFAICTKYCSKSHQNV